MAIHFSVGFVAELRPRRQYHTICAYAEESDIVAATVYMTDVVNSVINEDSTIYATWERRGVQCR